MWQRRGGGQWSWLMHAADSSDTPSVKMSSDVIVKVYKQALPLYSFVKCLRFHSMSMVVRLCTSTSRTNRGGERAGDECENLNVNRVSSPSKWTRLSIGIKYLFWREIPARWVFLFSPMELLLTLEAARVRRIDFGVENGEFLLHSTSSLVSPALTGNISQLQVECQLDECANQQYQMSQASVQNYLGKIVSSQQPIEQAIDES